MQLSTTEMNELGRSYFQKKKVSLVLDLLRLRWLWVAHSSKVLKPGEVSQDAHCHRSSLLALLTMSVCLS